MRTATFFLQPAAQALALDLEVVARLKVHLELLGVSEVPRKPDRRVGRDAALAVHDLVYSPREHAAVVRVSVLPAKAGALLVVDADAVRPPTSVNQFTSAGLFGEVRAAA